MPQRGTTAMEHPQEHGGKDYPSSCRTPLMTTYMNQLPEDRHNHIEQRKYSAKGCKPTIIRTEGVAPDTCKAALREAEDPTARRPTEELIGRDATGGWKTSSAKEYPPLRGPAVTRLLLTELRNRCRSHQVRPVEASHDTELFQWY